MGLEKTGAGSCAQAKQRTYVHRGASVRRRWAFVGVGARGTSLFCGRNPAPGAVWCVACDVRVKHSHGVAQPAWGLRGQVSP